MASSIAERLTAGGGAALLIDYGDVYEGATGDTIQAVRANRKIHDPFELLGEIDLTSRVDFGPIIKALQAGGCTVAGPIPQGDYLRNLGIELRTETLARPGRGTGGRPAQPHPAPGRSLRMGRLFQVLGDCPPANPCPPALSPRRPPREDDHRSPGQPARHPFTDFSVARAAPAASPTTA